MAQRGRPRHPDVLTPREWEVLALLREERSNEEIAERLGISLAGAKYHVSEILGTLGVASREEAAAWSAPGGRPWWAAVVAPLGALRRAVSASRLSVVGAAVAAMVIGVGLGLLVWGLVRTGGEEEAPQVTGALGPPAGLTSTPAPCPTDVPLNVAGNSFAYAAADGSIWVAGADGAGNQQVICDAIGPRSAAWSPSGRYIAHAGGDGRLWLLDIEAGRDTLADGGTTGSLLYTNSTQPSIFMRWSPSTDVLLYQKFAGDGRSSIGIWEVGPSTTAFELVRTGVARFDWSPDGRRIAYEVRGGVPTAPPNVRTNELFVVNANGGDAHKLTNGMFIFSDPWSPDGRLLAYWEGDHGGSSIIGDIHIMDIESGSEFSLGEFTSDENPQWSPARDRNVFHNLAIDAEGQSATPLFDRPDVIVNWSPDGKKVTYAESAEGGQRSLVMLEVASRERTTLHTGTSVPAHALGSGYYGQSSTDSRYYAFAAFEPPPEGGDQTALYVADAQSGQTRLIMDGFRFGEVYAWYSPDGSRLLIQRDERDSPTIWIANADGSSVSKVADGLALDPASESPAWRPTAP